MEIDFSAHLYFNEIYPKFPNDLNTSLRELKPKIHAKLANELKKQYEIYWWLMFVVAFVQDDEVIKFDDYHFVYKCRKSQNICSVEQGLEKDCKKLLKKIQSILKQKPTIKYRGIYKCSCVYEKTEVWI